MPFLTSGISKRYNKNFILDEDSLRRIQGALINASKKREDAHLLVYRAEREDSRFYETVNIDEILSDANIKGRRITHLFLRLHAADRREDGSLMELDEVAEIHFANIGSEVLFADKVELEIRHEDKTWALMLADEIEPQIERTFKAEGISIWIFILFLLPVLIVFFKLYFKYNFFLTPRPEHTNINDFVLRSVTLLLITLLLASIPIAYVFLFHPKWWRKLSAESFFLWGDEIDAYTRKKQFQQNFKWVIVAGLIISIIASVTWDLFKL